MTYRKKHLQRELATGRILIKDIWITDYYAPIAWAWAWAWTWASLGIAQQAKTRKA